MTARWPALLWVTMAGLACDHPSMESDEVTLLNTTEEWAVDGRRYALEAEGWRSFQPPQRVAGGDPLIVVVRLTSDAPMHAQVGGLTLINGDRTWSPSHGFEVRSGADENALECVVRDGPVDWIPGETVHVVASVIHGGASALLRARFIIQRVD